jgi:hypothetical protein
MRTDRSLEWKKSSRCASGACVEVAETGFDVRVRDAKEHNGAVLSFTNGDWNNFIAQLKRGV